MLTSKLTKAIGGNSDVFTSQPFVFQGSLAESEQVMLIMLLSAAGEDVFTKIKNIGLLTEQYFFNNDSVAKINELVEESTDSTIKNHDNSSLTERIHLTMDQLQSQMKEFGQKSILLAVLKDEVLYMLSSGGDRVILLREEKINELIQKGDTQLISGYLQPNDKVLFLSPRINISSYEESEIPLGWDEYFVQRLILSDQVVVEEEIGSYLNQLEIPEPIAAVLLSTQEAQEKVTIPELTEPEEEHSNPHPQITALRDRKHPISQSESPFKILPIFKIPKFNLPRLPNKLRRTLYRTIFPLSFKKLGLIFVIVIAIISSISISLYQVQQKNQKSANLSQAISQTRQNLTQAQNSRETDPDLAKQYLSFAKTSFEQAQGIEKENSEVKQLSSELSKAQEVILKTAEVSDWQTFLSLDLIRPDFNAKRMSFSLKKLLLLDENQKSLSLVDIETKSNQLLAGQSQLGNAKYASLNGDYAFVYSEDKGVLRIETNKRQITTVASPDKEWGRITDIVGFSSNVYLLDGTGNQIWKYVPTATSYTEKQIYLTDNQGLDFSNSLKLFIDFSVWVLKDEANLLRFTAGNKEFYSIGGIDEPIKKIDAMFVPEEEDKVFLLENGKKRLVITKKNGEYLSQYTSDKFGNATDLIYDEETKTLYLLEGGKIYQANIQ